MLETKVWSKIPFYVTIGFLVTGLLFTTYQFATYQQAYKGKGTELSFMKAQMEDLKEANDQLRGVVNQYYGLAMQYRQILERGIIMEKDTIINLKKGTVIIPPEPDKVSRYCIEE